MLSIKGKLGVETPKDKNGVKTKAIMTKLLDDEKDTDSIDMKELQRILKKISNEIIDMKKNCGEFPSNTNKFFRFPPKKSIPPTNKTTPPSEGLNGEDFIQAFKAWASDTFS
jgi:hypothetical protein